MKLYFVCCVYLPAILCYVSAELNTIEQLQAITTSLIIQNNRIVCTALYYFCCLHCHYNYATAGCVHLKVCCRYWFSAATSDIIA